MRQILIILIAVVVSSTTACVSETTSPSVTTTSTSEGQKSQAPAGTTAARQDTALVRFINAVPDGKAMDLISGEIHAFTNIPYKTVTPYKELQAHAGRFELRQTGGTKDVAVGLREIFPGRHYTVVALPEGNHSVRAAVLSDNLWELESGEAGVRLINATSGVDDIDLYIQGTSQRVGHAVDPGIADTVIVVKPGRFEIRQQGHPGIERLSNLKIEAGRLYTFVVIGTPATLDAIRIEDQFGS